jgi:hypothetical protein
MPKIDELSNEALRARVIALEKAALPLMWHPANDGFGDDKVVIAVCRALRPLLMQNDAIALPRDKRLCVHGVSLDVVCQKCNLGINFGG